MLQVRLAQTGKKICENLQPCTDYYKKQPEKKKPSRQNSVGNHQDIQHVHINANLLTAEPKYR